MNEQSVQSDQHTQISREDISRRAEEIWRNYGTPQGRDEEIWLEAERQLQSPAKSAIPANEDVSTAKTNSAPASTEAAVKKIPSKEAELMEKNSSSVPARPKAKSGKGR